MEIEEEKKGEVKEEFEDFLKFLCVKYDIRNKEPIHDMAEWICSLFEGRE